jgi:hypothetical protein
LCFPWPPPAACPSVPFDLPLAPLPRSRVSAPSDKKRPDNALLNGTVFHPAPPRSASALACVPRALRPFCRSGARAFLRPTRASCPRHHLPVSCPVSRAAAVLCFDRRRSPVPAHLTVSPSSRTGLGVPPRLGVALGAITVDPRSPERRRCPPSVSPCIEPLPSRFSYCGVVLRLYGSCKSLRSYAELRRRPPRPSRLECR